MRPAELNAVCQEIAASLTGASIQKIVQPDRRTVLLGSPGLWLLLSVDPQFGRLHLIGSRPPGSGEAAPAFCMLLRKELIGTRFSSCRAVEGERAAELVFRRGDTERRLWLFLFGRSAQLVLVDGAARPLGALGPAREVRTGLPQPRRAEEPDTATRFGTGPGMSQRISAHYQRELERSAIDLRRVQVTAKARSLVGRLTRLESGLGRDQARAQAAGGKRKWADLLLAHLHDVPRGASSVTLADDFNEGAPITIPLLPDRSARENAAKLYTDHKRLTRGLRIIDRRLAETHEARMRAEATLAAILAASDAEIAAIGLRTPKSPTPAASASSKRRGPSRTLPYREFTSGRGVAIWVGRGADRNDELTFRVARGSDLWLHARDVPGAHVVVPLAMGRAIDEETLVDAATLAAYHSSARGESQVDIAYTLRKHVRKPPRVQPGAVTTSDAKTIRVRIEPERLARLLASRADEER